jgi:hypothetical protein
MEPRIKNDRRMDIETKGMCTQRRQMLILSSFGVRCRQIETQNNTFNISASTSDSIRHQPFRCYTRHISLRNTDPSSSSAFTVDQVGKRNLSCRSYFFCFSINMNYTLPWKRMDMRFRLVFWVVTPCGLVGRSQRFGGTYRLHLLPIYECTRRYYPKDQH